MKMDLNLLSQMVQQKYIKVQKHPTEELFIYNYSEKTQYEKFWNDLTLQCRGLILNASGEIIARPFRKFFNLGERETEEMPSNSFEVFEKIDGSLGILYWMNDEPYIATRGSFISEQSMKANHLLLTKYAASIGQLNRSYTYLFEIIYPENRIVVDYGAQKALILLAMIDIETGKEIQLVDIGFPLVKKLDGIKDVNSLKSKEADNKEGFVIRFENNYRLKVKFDEYLRIHRIVTQVSSINIWEYLKEGKEWDDLLENVPDEFYEWVRTQRGKMMNQYQSILNQAHGEYKELSSRKETAFYFKTCKYPVVMFLLLDNKPVDHPIWELIRPSFEKPFSNKEET